MAETIVTVFVEGDTEVDFYKKLIAYLREKNGGRLQCKVDVRNVKGVGRYQNKVCRIFENSVKKQYPGDIGENEQRFYHKKYHVSLYIDTCFILNYYSYNWIIF